MVDESGGMPSILFEGVARDFEGRVAVEELDLRVGPGELFGLIGPNGAGKTTTIKLAVGLLRPSRGRVLICGYDIQRQGSEARRRLGYVPDNAALYEKLTGIEM
ncbi:ABC transporter ATP-binding protein, partial [mine drainage metagenome]